MRSLWFRLFIVDLSHAKIIFKRNSIGFGFNVSARKFEYIITIEFQQISQDN